MPFHIPDAAAHIDHFPDTHIPAYIASSGHDEISEIPARPFPEKNYMPYTVLLPHASSGHSLPLSVHFFPDDTGYWIIY